jgi:hypothetical protein
MYVQKCIRRHLSTLIEKRERERERERERDGVRAKGINCVFTDLLFLCVFHCSLGTVVQRCLLPSAASGLRKKEKKKKKLVHCFYYCKEQAKRLQERERERNFVSHIVFASSAQLG